MSEHVADDGTVRQNYYGAGVQPWDTALTEGWAPGFAAVNVLKYLRRDKEPEHSLKSARWYWGQICDRAAKEEKISDPWSTVQGRLLYNHLTTDECNRLNP